jgi:Endonuclease/Exonuclease/phosphatase family
LLLGTNHGRRFTGKFDDALRPAIETQIRIVTWNLWWRLGDWKARAEAIAETLVELRPDLVCLQEVWQEGDLNQAALLASLPGSVAPTIKVGADIKSP